ncbi:MAG: tetratricopeptide repeat protein [Treponemataceae bacterium]|nr:tetratricopeptide repeat protein [Treponemataceae bacterium]
MEAFFPILIAAVVVISFAVLLVVLISAKKKIKPKSSRQKGRQTIINEATKKLASDPHNVQALQELGELYYQEKNWEKAMPLFSALVGLAKSRKGINEGDANLKLGVCSINCNNPQQAFNALMASRKIDADNFEVNFYMGKTLHALKEYEKAIPILKKAIAINNEIGETYELLGKTYYDAKKFRDALSYLKKALDFRPDDKELFFKLADSLVEAGNSDKAIKIFMHLRPDPEYGAQSCLAAGKYHMRMNQFDEAIKDFEIGVKHQKAPVDVQMEIKYRLATCYLNSNNIPAGLAMLKSIQASNPNYKDVSVLISKYQELNQNSNLKTFLIGTTSEFVALCRRIVVVYYKNSRVKIMDINVTSECAEILAEIDTDKWEDFVMFRFYRTTGSTGEFFIRDFHAKIRDEKAGRGICFTAGTYTEEARAFTEGRPIDLVEKTTLSKILSSVEAGQVSKI